MSMYLQLYTIEGAIWVATAWQSVQSVMSLFLYTYLL